jgi:hypothetical protein
VESKIEGSPADPKCARCGVTNAEHVKKFGRSLDVHRTVADGDYYPGACELLCRKCHGKQARLLAKCTEGKVRVWFWGDEAWVKRVCRLAEKERLPFPTFVSLAVEFYLERKDGKDLRELFESMPWNGLSDDTLEQIAKIVQVAIGPR